MRLLTSRLIRNVHSVSYLPIGPPAWLQINGDQLKGRPFRGGINLPEVFYLGEASRCSCGSRAPGIGPTILEVIIFTSTTAIRKSIETAYCLLCRYAKGRVGPDLGEFGIFNWNNCYAFSRRIRKKSIQLFWLFSLEKRWFG